MVKVGGKRDAEAVVECYLAMVHLVALGEDLVPLFGQLQFFILYAGIFNIGHFVGLLSISCDRDPRQQSQADDSSDRLHFTFSFLWWGLASGT